MTELRPELRDKIASILNFGADAIAIEVEEWQYAEDDKHWTASVNLVDVDGIFVSALNIEGFEYEADARIRAAELNYEVERIIWELTLRSSGQTIHRIRGKDVIMYS